MYLDTKLISDIIAVIFVIITIIIVITSFISVWLIGLRKILSKGAK